MIIKCILALLILPRYTRKYNYSIINHHELRSANHHELRSANHQELTNITIDDNLYYKRGYNEAYFIDDCDSLEQLYKIYDIYEKEYMLKNLESSQLSVYDKIDIIKKYNIIDNINENNIGINLISGGLMNDWNFSLFEP